MAHPTYKILIMGASYGSLLATKMLFGGHKITLVCLPEEADLINSEGTRVRMPVRGQEGLVEIDSRTLPGELSAAGTDAVDPNDFDLVGLAMQEPQYRAPGVRDLLDKVARSKVPCMSIMNMPPLAYLWRLPGIDARKLEPAFTDAGVWANFEPGRITLCSPDPQAFRPPEEKLNVLQVTLPTNFKAARFDDEESTQILRNLQKDIEDARFEKDGQQLELPVKLKVHDSIYVPLAKWAMLLTGNYRCITENGAQSIKEAVHNDLGESRAVYKWVADLCVSMGASPDDMVPFEKYANAAQGLVRPSSAARALFSGAPNIERVDRLVQLIAEQKGQRNESIDRTVALVDAQLEKNRREAA